MYLNVVERFMGQTAQPTTTLFDSDRHTIVDHDPLVDPEGVLLDPREPEDLGFPFQPVSPFDQGYEVINPVESFR